VSGVTGYFAQDTLWEQVGQFSSCTECSCVYCFSFSMTANTTGVVSWLDCDGIKLDTFLLAGQTYTIPCIGARAGTVSGDVILDKGPVCFNSCVTPTPTPTIPVTPTPTPTSPTPTPTATPDSTPTPTPSTGLVPCYNYINNSDFAWFGSYVDCFGNPVPTGYLPPYESICAQDGSPITDSGQDLVPIFTCYG
jgi:hypothetical protein